MHLHEARTPALHLLNRELCWIAQTRKQGNAGAEGRWLDGENQMVEEGRIEIVPSFLIESCVWDVPDSTFQNAPDWTARIRAALAHIFNETMNDGCVGSDAWLEANAIKYLFAAGQSWDWRDAHRFASAAWDYIGFD